MNPNQPTQKPQAPLLPNAAPPPDPLHVGMRPEKLSPTGRALFNKIEFDESESLVCEIRKHPFGLFLIYLGGFLVAALMLGLSVAASVLLAGDTLGVGADTNQFRSLLIIVGIVLAGLAILSSFLGGFIYRSNILLVTNEKIAQVLYRNLIDRKISQLSIGDVQDVTVTQNGLFARFFNYGTLVIETAGEQQNYDFTYAPDPYELSKCIVNAHEENLKLYGN